MAMQLTADTLLDLIHRARVLYLERENVYPDKVHLTREQYLILKMGLTDKHAGYYWPSGYTGTGHDQVFGMDIVATEKSGYEVTCSAGK